MSGWHVVDNEIRMGVVIEVCCAGCGGPLEVTKMQMGAASQLLVEPGHKCPEVVSEVVRGPWERAA